MRRAVCLMVLALSAGSFARADQAGRDRLNRYFTSWFSVCPGTRVSVAEANEIVIPGYEAYRVERKCDSKHRDELSITLLDRSRGEVFVGEVLHSDERRNQPFAAERDLPVLQAALRDTFGVPVVIVLDPGSRGALRPFHATIRQAEGAEASLSGFVSEDGATLLLGEFFSLDVDPHALRERLLSESEGVRPPKGTFRVTAFIDFQCERCRVRTPQMRDFVWSHGGALEIRFLPLVKVHNWAFAAAESAAALADVSPALYAKYEEALFSRASTMTEKAARELAADIADAAAVREAFDAERQSGRARERVLRDINLALRLGLNSTPVFVYRGALLTGEPALAEGYIQGRLGGSAKDSGKGARR